MKTHKGGKWSDGTFVWAERDEWDFNARRMLLFKIKSTINCKGLISHGVTFFCLFPFPPEPIDLSIAEETEALRYGCN